MGQRGTLGKGVCFIYVDTTIAFTSSSCKSNPLTFIFLFLLYKKIESDSNWSSDTNITFSDFSGKSMESHLESLHVSLQKKKNFTKAIELDQSRRSFFKYKNHICFLRVLRVLLFVNNSFHAHFDQYNCDENLSLLCLLKLLMYKSPLRLKTKTKKKLIES